jgi:formylglycine-generating enzyme required for sulfatase activity/serine/threonine protein kinase/WD40 repeat protein
MQKASTSDEHKTPIPSGSGSELETLPPRPIPPSATLPGLTGTFGRYKIEALLGQGGMGAVYLARDTQLDRLVALKTPRFENDKDGELLNRFYREAKAAGTVNHPHVCPVYGVEEINGRPFLAMAYIEGRPLSDYIHPDKFRPERQVLVVIRKLALALQEAHDRGIVHRDLKPANVMIDKRGEPIVMDFGLARPVEVEQDSKITTTGVVIGSPAYMAPEQIDDDFGKIGHHTDQYALGVILYELLTGNVPFRGSIAAIYGKIVSRPPISLRRIRPELDPRIDALALRMMAKRPSERLPSMRAVAEAVQEILAKPASPPVAKPAATTRRLRSPQQIAALVAQASDLVEDHKYDKAVDLLETVLPEERTPELTRVLEEALELSDEVTYLTARLLDAWTRGSSQDEIPSVRRLLELVPDHSLGLKILEKLKQESSHWWAGFSVSTPLGFSSTTLSALSQWGLFLVTLFSFTFGTMVFYFNLAESSLKKDANLTRAEQPEIKQDLPATSTATSQARAADGIRYTGMKKIKRLTSLPLAFILSVSPSPDARKLLVSGVPENQNRSPDGAWLIDVADGSKKVIPDGWAYSTLLPDGKQAALLSIRPKTQGANTKYSTDLSIVDLVSMSVAWQRKQAHDHLCWSLAATKNSRFLVTGGMDDTKAWDLVDRKLLWTKPFPGFDVNFDLDGTDAFLVSKMGRRLVKIDDVTGKKSHDVPLPLSGVHYTALDTSRNNLVAGMSVLNASDFQPRWILDKSNPKLHSLAILPDRRHLFTSTAAGDVSVWSLETGQKDFSTRLETQAKDPAVGTYGLQAVVAGDGKTVFAFPPQYVGEKGDIQLLAPLRGEQPWIDVWELESEPLKQAITTPSIPSKSEPLVAIAPSLPKPAGEITAATLAWSLGGDEATFGKRGRLLDYSSDGKFLAVFDGDKPPQIVNAATGKIIRQIPQGPNTWVRFIPGSSEVLLLHHQGLSPLDALDVLSGKKREAVPIKIRKAYNLGNFTPDHKLLFLEGRWDYFSAYDWKAKTLSEEQIIFPNYRFDPEKSHLAVNRDGSIVAFAHGPTTEVILWDRINKKQLARFQAHQPNKWLTSIHFSPDDQFLATTSHEQNVKIWNASNGSLVKEYPETDWVQSGTYSPDGKYFASASHFEGTKIRELSSGRIVASIPRHQVHMSDLAWSSDGKFIATVSSEHSGRSDERSKGFAELKLWKLEFGSSKSSPSINSPAELQAPFSPAAAQQAQQQWSDYLKQPVELPNSVGMKMRLIPPGRFRMGSLESKEEAVKFAAATGVKDPPPDSFNEEYPAHDVRILPFALSTTEVTFAQFRKFVEATGHKTQAEKDGKGKGFFSDKEGPKVSKEYSFRNIGIPLDNNFPAVNVSWDDAQAFCKWLSRSENKRYRLPYEAEWEYACRAGTITRFVSGDDPQSLVRVANVGDASARSRFPQWNYSLSGNDGYPRLAPVAQFSANPFGLYDMHGNVWEWCQDVYQKDYYRSAPDLTTPQGPMQGDGRVLRGGSHSSLPRSIRSSERGFNEITHKDTNLGFRVALEIPLP